ncbi:hypothetical protein E5225_17235 [Cellulomonas shaoxiangyii]|uniref:AbiEi antitoxin N-terminal domain-containing protein n=1 Tax=Cellulomonas shaoxiangyii TaxID=2566013 RepID=A0A4P7SMB6_9CELL|nr:hypothetical protein E5225_17235 [Cellulomonas shaoxiangyii]TGY86419.1 hypothetical protein E5226_02320 [Cellulomonas shaoxiangyii]
MLRTDVATWPDVVALAEPVRSLVVRQEGAATTAQLGAGGVPARTVARRVRSGRWQRVHRGVVVLQSGPLRWRQRAHAALLAAGAGAALSHASAAYLHGFVAAPGPSVVVSVPAERAVRPQRGVQVRRRGRVPRAWGRLRCVGPEDTLLDLVHEAPDEDAAVALACDAVRAGVRPDVVLVVAGERAVLRHRALVRAVLGDPSLGVESPLEHRYVRDVERRHGLPRSAGQVRQRVGGRWIRSDRAYPGVRVELDGQLAHPFAATDADVWRDNAVLLASADITLRYRWRHVVATPCRVAHQVAAALTTRGHPVTLRRCPRCPAAATRDRPAHPTR